MRIVDVGIIDVLIIEQLMLGTRCDRASACPVAQALLPLILRNTVISLRRARQL